MTDDAPLQRILKIGRVNVGLLGLDVALLRVLERPDLALETAVAEVYEAVARHNYIPAAAADLYRQALAAEITRLREGTGQALAHLEVRILGTGCVSCNNLQKLVIEIMAARGLVADVFQVHDPDEIGRFGVLQTPALVINGQVKSVGRLPTRAEIEDWLLAAAEEMAS